MISRAKRKTTPARRFDGETWQARYRCGGQWLAQATLIRSCSRLKICWTRNTKRKWKLIQHKKRIKDYSTTGSCILADRGKRTQTGAIAVKILLSKSRISKAISLSMRAKDLIRIGWGKPGRAPSLGRRSIWKNLKKDSNESFCKDAQLYSDLKGNLVVKAKLRRPIARLIRNDGPDGYIAEDGTVMPVSDKFTTRVVLISGSYIRGLLSLENLNKTKKPKPDDDAGNDSRRWFLACADCPTRHRQHKAASVFFHRSEGRPSNFMADNLETKFKEDEDFF